VVCNQLKRFHVTQTQVGDHELGHLSSGNPLGVKDPSPFSSRMNHAAQVASTSGSASSPPLGKDPQLPLPADWDRMKDVIHSLYIGKNLPLKYVRAEMERDHSFKAT
jgi:hypothetical protein